MTSENPLPPPTSSDPAPTTPVATPSTPTTPATAPVPSSPLTPASPMVGVVAAPRRSGTWLNVLLGVAALVAVGGVAFAVGRSTASAATPRFAGFDGNGTVVAPDGSFDPGAIPGGGGAGAPNVIGAIGDPSIDGTVTAIDADSITITLANGEDMTIALDDATTYHSSTDASASDVAVGDEVSVGIGGFGRGPGAGAGGDDTDSAPTAQDVTVSR